MKTSVKFSKILAVILTATLMLTLLTATVFADTNAPENTEAAPEATGDVTEAPADDAAETTDEHEGHDHGDETTAATDEDEHDHSINWIDIIVTASIIVLGAIAFVICYFAIPKFRAKVQKFFSDYKSELKKVTWSSKQDVKRNTIIVIVIVAALAIAIALLDIIFSGGIEALSHLI